MRPTLIVPLHSTLTCSLTNAYACGGQSVKYCLVKDDTVIKKNRRFGSSVITDRSSMISKRKISRLRRSSIINSLMWLRLAIKCEIPLGKEKQARAEFPIQLLGRVPHQLSGLPHQLCALPHQLLSDLTVSGSKRIFSTAGLQSYRIRRLRNLNSCLPGFPRTAISWHDILPHQLFPKSSTHRNRKPLSIKFDRFYRFCDLKMQNFAPAAHKHRYQPHVN